MNRDHHTCIECENEYHDEHEWHRNALDQHVCDMCADNLPRIYVSLVTYLGFYGEGKMRTGTEAENITTQFFKTHEEARTDVIRMCKRQWVNASPLEEEEEV